MFGISNTLLTVLTVDLLATSGDITGTWSSPMYTKLSSNDSSVNPLKRPITEDEYSWVGSLLNIGAVCGALPIGIIADKIGRKYTLLSIAIPHIVAYIIYAFANNIYLFYLGRIINGFSEGAGYAILPMYVAEITEDSNRASMSVTLNIFWTLGNFIPYAIGPYVTVRIFNLILAAVPTTFLICFLLIGLETPHYLIYIGKDDKAKENLIHLRSCTSAEVDKELKKLKEVVKTQENSSFLDIVREAPLRKALILSVLMIVFQQLSGVNALSFYLEKIFDTADAGLSPAHSTTICGACMFFFSFAAPFIIDLVGKKWMLGISCMGDGLCLFALGGFFYVHSNTTMSISDVKWLPIAAVISYIFFFNFGWGSLPWTISSELFPNKVKAVSASAVAGASWMGSFMITKFFGVMSDYMGEAGVFWFYGVCCVIATVFQVIWIPETKGKTLGQIQEMLKS